MRLIVTRCDKVLNEMKIAAIYARKGES